ncbi:SMI1/KNR4 family protein, partial [Actinoplanes sp. NPDC051633]|uniref:SMI1/KNR4 family protein n=1 Tax=Actinoplanes sp. NPDC051633 TaxID=3155670 RepID=UPI00343FAEC9
QLLEQFSATYVELRDGTVEDARETVRALATTHGLVLVVGVPGLLVPLGTAGWTLRTLASALSAPVIVVSDDLAQATLALGALEGHTAAVLAVGDDLEELPVRAAGRVPPADSDDFAAAARDALDPLLHATSGVVPAEPPRPSGGHRVVFALLGVFLAMAVVVVGIAYLNRAPDPLRGTGVTPRPVVVFTPAPEAPEVTGPRPVSQMCPEFRGQVKPTTPEPATTARVNAAWKRIETWLAAKAPKDARTLRPPAKAGAIVDLQRRMSVAFPADLVASLLRHDGVQGGGFELPFFFWPIPVDGIADHWLSTCTVLAHNGGADTSEWWDKAYVPFASSGDGGYLFVDQRPRWGNGRVGEFYNEDGVKFEGWPPTVADLLEETALSLESGRPFRDRFRPRVKDGSLEWVVLLGR